MSKWKQISIGEFVDFNPPEKIEKGKLAKKIPMAMLTEFERKIKGFEFAEYQSGPKFKNGDTLVAKITPCLENGKTAQVDILDDNEVAFGSSEFIVLRENNNSINDYIFYLAKSPVFRERAIGCMEGTSGRRRVNERALKRQEIKVPDKSSQQKIVAVLSALDDKIELNNKINAKLETMAQTIYDYWFVQFDFPDKNNKPYKSSGGKIVYNEILKREIPEGWKVKTIDEVYDLYQPETVSEKELNNEGKYLVFGANGIIGRYNKYNHEFAQVTITCRGNSCGNINVTQPYSWITGNAMVARPKIEHYNILFTKCLLLAANISNFITGSAQPQITRANLSNMHVVVPSKELTQKFNEATLTSHEMQVNLFQENQKLSSLRDWLLPMLMNGQVKVGNVEEEVLNIAAEDAAIYTKKKSIKK